MVGPVPPPYGGIASVMDDIVNSGLKNEYAFEVFNRAEQPPADIKGKWRKRLFQLRILCDLFRKARKGKFDLAHIHFSCGIEFLRPALQMAAVRLAGVKVLLHLHGTAWEPFYDDATRLGKIYALLGLWIPNLVLVLYDLWAKNIKKLVPSTRVVVMKNLVDETPTPDVSQVEETLRELGFSPDDFIVITVGSMGRRKGYFEIVKAIPEIIALDRSVKFLFVGGEEHHGEMDEIEDQIRKHGLENFVRITGETTRERVPVYLSIADIFILPTFREGAPISILEAMRSGLPVVSTPVGGIPNMINDCESGLLINPGQPSEIATAVLRLKNDEELRNRLSQGARKCFENNFSISKGIRELGDLYESI
jgi:glycosyltransferase involved in cell wall biosynthesis